MISTNNKETSGDDAKDRESNSCWASSCSVWSNDSVRKTNFSVRARRSERSFKQAPCNAFVAELVRIVFAPPSFVAILVRVHRSSCPLIPQRLNHTTCSFLPFAPSPCKEPERRLNERKPLHSLCQCFLRLGETSRPMRVYRDIFFILPDPSHRSHLLLPLKSHRTSP